MRSYIRPSSSSVLGDRVREAAAHVACHKDRRTVSRWPIVRALLRSSNLGGLSHGEFAVVVAMLDRLPNIAVSQSRLAKDAHVSRSTVNRATGLAVKAGLFRRERRQKAEGAYGVTRYELAVDPKDPSAVEAVIKRLAHVAGEARQKRVGACHGGDRGSVIGETGVVSPVTHKERQFKTSKGSEATPAAIAALPSELQTAIQRVVEATRNRENAA